MILNQQFRLRKDTFKKKAQQKHPADKPQMFMLYLLPKKGNMRLKRWVSKSKYYWVFSESSQDSGVFCPY